MADAESVQSVETDVDPELSSEHEQVLRWRYEEIRKLGMSRLDARLLADSEADLNLLRRLAAAGCPAATAVRIAL
jgi:hypothetical protein